MPQVTLKDELLQKEVFSEIIKSFKPNSTVGNFCVLSNDTLNAVDIMDKKVCFKLNEYPEDTFYLEIVRGAKSQLAIHFHRKARSGEKHDDKIFHNSLSNIAVKNLLSGYRLRFSTHITHRRCIPRATRDDITKTMRIKLKYYPDSPFYQGNFEDFLNDNTATANAAKRLMEVVYFRFRLREAIELEMRKDKK